MRWCPKNNSDTNITKHCMAVTYKQINMKIIEDQNFSEFAIRIK